MDKVQRFEISYSDSEVQIDGLLDSSLLESVMGKDVFGRLYCQRVDAIYLKWPKVANIPNLSLWKEALSLGAEVKLVESNSSSNLTMSVEIRNKGIFSSSLETLVYYWLDSQNFTYPSSCCVASRYKFSGKLSDKEWKKLEAIFQKLSSLEEKSPLFDFHTQELKIINNESLEHWFETSSNKHDFNQKDVQDRIKFGVLSPSRQSAVISFARGDSVPITRNIKSPIEGLGRYKSNGFVNDTLLDLLISLPRRQHPDRYPWQTLSRSVDAAISMYARSPSIISTRVGYSLCSKVNAMSAIPQLLKAPLTNENRKGLYFLGPWNSQNHIIQRCIEEIVQSNDKLFDHMMLVDQSDDWIAALFLMLKDSDGYSLEYTCVSNLFSLNESKGSDDKILFIRCSFEEAQDIAQMECLYPLRLRSFGIPTNDGIVVSEDLSGNKVFELSVEQINLILDQRAQEAILGKWQVPYTKSTTFGYDRALVYPDQYMLKITNIPAMKKPFTKKQWSCRSSERHMHVQMRGKESAYLNSVKLKNRNRIDLISWGLVRRTIEIDPSRSGHVAVDHAFRWHLCQGSSLKGLMAEVFISCPARNFSELSPQKQVQLKLLLDGINYACLQYEIDNLGERFLPSTDHNGEIFAWVRVKSSELVDEVSNVFSGFRMNEENIVALGPRPPFVDAGSRILGHVRVFSNYMTELNFESQFEIYTRVAEMIRNNKVNCIYPIGPGGVAETLFEMALWGERGIRLKPMINTIELFSGAPGRVLMGVATHELEVLAKEFDSEKVLPVGTVNGDKVLGLSLEEIQKARGN